MQKVSFFVLFHNLAFGVISVRFDLLSLFICMVYSNWTRHRQFDSVKQNVLDLEDIHISYKNNDVLTLTHRVGIDC